MKVGVLGTGAVGQAIATKLVEVGHDVCMGSRVAGNEKALAWVSEVGERAAEGAFAVAAEWGEIIFNCTAGAHALEALEAAGGERLEGKVLVDVSNALDFSRGAPRLDPVNDDSLGERIQRAFLSARVVKALNTVNAKVMVDPGRLAGDHVVFVCGEDEAAKRQVTELLGEFGWPAERVVDLGGIAAARRTEMYLMLWLGLMDTLGTTEFNITLAR